MLSRFPTVRSVNLETARETADYAEHAEDAEIAGVWLLGSFDAEFFSIRAFRVFRVLRGNSNCRI